MTATVRESPGRREWERRRLHGGATAVSTAYTDDVMATHVAAPDPHVGYQLESTLAESVQDIVGAFILAGTGITAFYDDGANTLTISNSDRGTTAVATHEAAGDPHPQYTTAAELAAYAQPLDATLSALAAANWAANSFPIGTGADTLSQVAFAANTFPARAAAGNLEAKTITTFGLSLVDDADAAAGRTTLALGTIATQNANAVAITGGAIDGTPIGATTASTVKATTVQTTGLSGFGAAPATYRVSITDTASAGANVNVLFTSVADTAADTSVGILMSAAGSVARACEIRAVGNGSVAGNGHALSFLTAANGGSPVEALRITHDKRVYATGIHNNAGAVTGTVNQYIASGTVASPTLFNTTNVAASTTGKQKWIRVGNTVHVSGTVQVDPTAAGANTVLGIAVPIASNFATAADASGSGGAIDTANEAWGIEADAVNDRLLLKCFAVNAGNHTVAYQATYEVL